MSSTSRSIRLGVAGVIAALALATISTAASAGRVPDDWGWAVVRNPVKSGYEITGKDRATSTGGKVTVKRLGQGYHYVRFAGITTDTAHAQVTPLSGNGDMCNFHGLGVPGQPLRLYVNCRNRLGVPSDTRFMVNFVEAHGFGAPRMAYLWAHQPKTANYPAHPVYAYTSNGGAATVQRLGLGKYRVHLAGLGGPGGNVQVTPMMQKARTCRVLQWFSDVQGLVIDVRCRDQRGQAAHAKFHLLFTDDVGMKGNQGDSWAYLFANKPKVRGYRPDPGFSASSPFGKPWVKRLSTGRYIVKLPTMPLGGAAQVTAVDDWKHCHASTVRKADTPQRIEVRCFKANGKARADAKFLLSYAR